MSGFFLGEEFASLALELAAADFNNDGIDDYIIANHNGNSGEGEVIVVFGRTMGEAPFYSVNDLANDEYIILQSDTGLTSIDRFAQFSRAIETGDFNGDGLIDIAVSASRENSATDSNLGSVSIFYGRTEADTDTFLENLTDNTWDGINFDGTDGIKYVGNAAGDGLGANLFNLGDRDGDGGDELAIATINIGATPNELTILWSGDDTTTTGMSIGDLPDDRLSIITDLPDSVYFVNSVPFEAVDPDPIRELETRRADFITNDINSDIGIAFSIGGSEAPLVIEGELITRGSITSFDNLPENQSYRTPYDNPDQYDIRSAAVSDINGDFVPEFWYSFYGSDGVSYGLDWRIIPAVDANGDLLEGVSFDPDNLPAGVEEYRVPQSDGTDPFGGVAVRSGDFFGDFSNWIDFVYAQVFAALEAGDFDLAFALVDTVQLLFEEPDNLDAMAAALAFVSTNSNQGLGDGGFEDGGGFFNTLSVDPEPEAAIQSTGPTPIFDGGAIDIVRNFLMTQTPTQDATQFDGNNGYRIFGQDQGAAFAQTSVVADVTGDGVDDLIFSSPQADTFAGSNSGVVMTLAGGEKNLRAQDAEDGSRDGIIFTSSLMQTAELRAGLTLFTNDYLSSFGTDIAAAGDVNGDGLGDFLISQPFGDSDSTSDVGEVHVIYGRHNFDGAEITLSTPSFEEGLILVGDTRFGELGVSVAGVGDVNGDGYDDILVGAPQTDPGGQTNAGTAYLIYGPGPALPLTNQINVDQLGATQGVTFIGSSSPGLAGTFVTGINDINGDGIAEMAIAASAADETGLVHIIFGGTVLPQEFDLGTLNGTNGFTVEGAERFDALNKVVSVGDLDGDGFNDIMLADGNLSEPAQTHVIFGTDQGYGARIDLSDITAVLNGPEDSSFGDGLSGGGDFNGDGRTDFLVVAPEDDTFGEFTGSVSLFLGSPDFLSNGPDVTPEVEFGLGFEDVLFNNDSTFVGDVNGDGLDDILIGAADSDIDNFPGGVFLVFGRPEGDLGATFDLNTLDGHNGYRFVGSTFDEGFGRALAGLGDIDGDGRDDFAMGLPLDMAVQTGNFANVEVIFGGEQNLIALDLADGQRDGIIDYNNTDIAYTESALSLLGNGIWEGGFLADIAGVGSLDADGDQIGLGDDIIDGREGNDFILSGGGMDMVSGGSGDDTLAGQTGNDTIDGGAGNDALSGDEGDDSLLGGDGADNMLGGLGDDTLEGGDGDDTQDGEDGDDVLLGGDGDDFIIGGIGNDTLTGGAGNDLLAGGDGADVFVSRPGDDTITITDFESGVDKLDLSGIFRLTALDAYFDRAAGSTILTLPDDQTVIIQNIDPEELLPTDLILEGENIPLGGSLVTFVFGPLEVGEELVPGYQSLNDPEGIDRSTESFQWLRDGQPISGATDERYTLTEADVGSDISLQYTVSDFFGETYTRTSDARGPVSVDNAPTVGRPLIIGDVIAENETLGIDVSTTTDADGIDEDSYEYQWVRDGVEIDGATEANYVLTQADVGSEIQVWLTLTDLLGRTSIVGSLATEEVANVNDPLEGPLRVTGEALAGETLFAGTEDLVDPDGIASISWQWYRLFTDTNVAELIVGATEQSYVVTEADRGFFISPWATVTDDFGNQQLRTNVGKFYNQEPLGQPTIVGDGVIGSTLSVDLSTINDPDGLRDTGTLYQWYRDNVPITDALEATYTVTVDDLQRDISVEVRYRDDANISERVFSDSVVGIDEPVIEDGTPGPDADLTGASNNDILRGLGGDDTLTGLGGDDTLDGGDGIDTGVFGGPQGAYTLTLSPSAVTLEDRREDGTGTDSLSGIELLDFDTGTFNLDIFDGPTGLSAEEFGAIVELYIAYFNRAPDALGLYYWGTEFSNGFSLPEMALSFFGQPETQATYAAVLDEMGKLDIADQAKVDAFVTEVYANVLGRAPDAPGFEYWTDQLVNNSQFITPDIFILSIIGGAKNPGNPTPQTDLDQAYLATKADLGAYFAVIKGMSDLDDAAASLALFDGTPDSVTATVAAIDGHFADALDADTGDFLMPLVGVIDDPFGMG